MVVRIVRLACPGSSQKSLSGLTILVPNLTKRSRKRSQKWSCDKHIPLYLLGLFVFLRIFWCPEEDSNLHVHTDTST